MAADWLAPLRSALEARDTAEVFFRDDDAGWEDQRLMALLDRFSRQHTPIDLAVIPEALSEPLADELSASWQREPALLGLHQHGYAHLNHEAAGRKCEFGSSRNGLAQSRDIAAGRERLGRLLGPALDPIFTPPWNRCTGATGDCLAALGFQALSRDRTAAALGRSDLRELPVHLDWCGIRSRSQRPWADLGQALAEGLEETAFKPFGIMLHHGVMDGEDLDHVDQLLGLLRDHARPRLMREFLD